MRRRHGAVRPVTEFGLLAAWARRRKKPAANALGSAQRVASGHAHRHCLQTPDVTQYADRRVRWQGVLDPEAYVLLDNRLHRGRVGYHVVALIEAGDGSVPVNLGWLAGDPSRRTVPVVNVMDGACANRGAGVCPEC